MNATLQFYKRFGIWTEKIMAKFQTQPILKGMSVMSKQTPGRAQYYYSETLHLIPESVYYRIRMPKTLAGALDSKKYEDVVEQEVMKYLETRLPHNLFEPEKGLHLDLTVRQVRQMLRASEKSFKRASTGELQQIINTEKDIGANVDLLRDKIDDQLDQVQAQLEKYYNETIQTFSSAEFPKSSQITEFIPYLRKGRLTRMIDDVENALAEDQHNEDIQELMKRLYFIAKAKVAIADTQLKLVNYWNEYNTTETYDKVCFAEAHQRLEDEKQVFNKFTKDTRWANEKSPFDESLNQISENLLPEYRQNCSEYESARSKKENFYASFIHDESYMRKSTVKEELFAHLSSAIILKEHRYRYQHEQYDRFLNCMKWIPLWDNMTLRDFSKEYALQLRNGVLLSHNGMCPQIDANYDDFDERKVNPITPTVFYFFFSAHKARRRFAQVILSAARYPNEKIRRAYLRFFSNA
jgi:hypothetical protein